MRQTDKGGHTNGQGRQTDGPTNGQKGRQTGRQTDRRAEKRTEKRTGGQTDRRVGTEAMFTEQ